MSDINVKNNASEEEKDDFNGKKSNEALIKKENGVVPEIKTKSPEFSEVVSSNLKIKEEDPLDTFDNKTGAEYWNADVNINDENLHSKNDELIKKQENCESDNKQSKVDKKVRIEKVKKELVKDEVNAEEELDSGLRRSRRQRKPVEFLKLENTPSTRRNKNKVVVEEVEKTNGYAESIESDQVQPQPKKRGPKRKYRKSSAAPEKKVKIKKAKRGPKPKNAVSSGEESDGEVFVAQLEQYIDECKDELSSLSKISSDHIESDFNPNDDRDSDEVESVDLGRNLARQKRRLNKSLNVQEIEVPCQICDKDIHPEWLLLCDKCDLGHHAMCVIPPLYTIPSGEWFCPKCNHLFLIDSLKSKATELKENSQKVVSNNRMQDRLAYINISMSNIISSARKKNDVVTDEESFEEEHSSSSANSVHSNYSEKFGLRKRSRITYASESSVDSDPDYGAQLRKRKPVKRTTPCNRRRARKSYDRYQSDSEESLESEVEIPKAKRQAALKQVSYQLDEYFKNMSDVLSSDQCSNGKSASKSNSENSDASQGEHDSDEKPKLSIHRRKPKKKKSKYSSDSGEEYAPEPEPSQSESVSEPTPSQSESDNSWDRPRKRRSAPKRVRRARVAFSGDSDSDYRPSRSSRSRRRVVYAESDDEPASVEENVTSEEKECNEASRTDESVKSDDNGDVKSQNSEVGQEEMTEDPSSSVPKEPTIKSPPKVTPRVLSSEESVFTDESEHYEIDECSE